MESEMDEWRLGTALQSRVDGRWLRLKDRGNELLRAGALAEARHCYTGALVLAQPALALSVLLRGALVTPESLLARLCQADVLLRRIFGFLSNGLGPVSVRCGGLAERIQVTVPNLPAAVCLANRSHAQLLLGSLEAAAADAELAARLCPEYVKGHRRRLEAYQRLGKCSERRDVGTRLRAYEESVRSLPFYATSLLMADFIRDEELALVYRAPWRAHCFEKVTHSARSKGHGRNVGGLHDIRGEVSVCVMLSLVNFLDGQWLMFSLNFLDEAFLKHKLDAVDFCCVDGSNGPALELPPNGHASESALKLVPSVMRSFFGELKERGIVAFSLMLGQGLTEQMDLLQPVAEEFFEPILVYPAVSTGASMAYMESALGLPERSLG